MACRGLRGSALLAGLCVAALAGVCLAQDRMQWVLSSSPDALCNDFTRAGFFVRRNTSSDRWVIFLESGSLCFTSATCNRRFFRNEVSFRPSGYILPGLLHWFVVFLWKIICCFVSLACHVYFSSAPARLAASPALAGLTAGLACTGSQWY